MIIHCYTIDQFYEAIFALVVKGLTFEAEVNKLTIKLTGGF